nr:hypothetical protein [Bacteroidota bacterium]
MKAIGFFICGILVIFQMFNCYGQDMSKAYALKYNIEAGKTFAVDNRSWITDHKVIDGTSQKYIYTKTSMQLKYRVVSNSDLEGLLLEVEYRDKDFVNYRADGRVEDRDYLALINGKISYKMTREGEITGFEGFEELEARAEEGEINADGLQEEILHLFPHLPGHPIKIGDSWTGGVESDGRSEGFSLEYTLLDEEIVDGIDCLKFSANYTTESNFPYESKDKMYNVTTHSTGHDIYYFAYKKGFLLSRISIGHGGLEIYTLQDSLVQKRTNEVLYETKIKF